MQTRLSMQNLIKQKDVFKNEIIPKLFVAS